MSPAETTSRLRRLADDWRKEEKQLCEQLGNEIIPRSMRARRIKDTKAIDAAVEMIERLEAKGQDQAMQDVLMKFDPATGEERPYPSHATQWRNWHGTAAWLFDPWTGKQRNAYDVGSDVYGLLIAPAGTLGMDMGGSCATTNKGVMKRARRESK